MHRPLLHRGVLLVLSPADARQHRDGCHESRERELSHSGTPTSVTHPSFVASNLLMGLKIRPATAADADGISRTFLESAEHHAPYDPERYSIPDFEAVAARYQIGRQHPAEVTSITLVAELDEEAVGFVDARIEQSPDPMLRPITYCHIAELAVRAGHRSRGIGRQLMAAAEDWGRQQGAGFAFLDYHVSNGRAAGFYQRVMGYRAAHITAVKRLQPR